MPFDPDKYLADKAAEAAPSSGGFDPDAYLASKLGEGPAAAADEPSKLEALGRGAEHGLSLGMDSTIAGALKNPLGAAKATAGLLGMDTSKDKDVAQYAHARDAHKAAYDRAAEAHPVVNAVGNIVGGLPTMMATGGLGELAGLGELSNTARLAGQGAIDAGLLGAGTSNADLTKGQVGQLAKDAAGSAFTGAGTGALLGTLQPAIQSAANKFAVASVHPRLKDLRRMVGNDKIQEMGQHMNDAGIPGFLQGAEGTYSKLADATDQIGSQIDSVVAEHGATPTLETTGLAKSVGNDVRGALADMPEGGKTVDRVQNYLDNELSQKGTPIATPAREAAEEALARKRAIFNAALENKQRALDGSVGQQQQALETSLAQKRALLSGQIEAKGQGLGADLAQQQQGVAANSLAGTSSANKATLEMLAKSQNEEIANFAKQKLAEIDQVAQSGAKDIGDFQLAGQTDIDQYTSQTRGELANLEANIPPSERTLNLQESWNLRKGVDDALDFQRNKEDMPGFQQSLVTVRNKVQNAITGALPEEERGLFNQYHNLQAAEDMSKNALARQTANRFVSPTDYLTGLGGMLAHGGPTGAAMAAGNHVMRTRGASTAAWGLDKLSTMLRTNPAQFGSYSQALQNAAARGSQSLAAAHFILSQTNEGYRNQLNGLDGDKPK